MLSTSFLRRSYRVWLLTWFSVIFLACSFTQLTQTHAKDLTPHDVVLRWIRIYGKDMDQAATLTTLRYRKGRTAQQWAAVTQQQLSQLGYQHLDGKVVKETIQSNQAIVTLSAHISTKIGIVQQTETYTLLMEGQQWLIDRLVVSDEVLPREKISS